MKSREIQSHQIWEYSNDRRCEHDQLLPEQDDGLARSKRSSAHPDRPRCRAVDTCRLADSGCRRISPFIIDPVYATDRGRATTGLFRPGNRGNKKERRGTVAEFRHCADAREEIWIFG